ncbi:MAG: sigma 54-interacting transcriptional regulator [Spirochaetes bacterium]|nr:sigma 54-interacting transcriptional regulator [Spirochaetota bacterium]MBP8991398.1 sigma 54-interacting transcriptional regulator [Spirochaetota bacterium]HOV46510.1 sigma 54-interacting transcriptional regulator [Exilispira sp.]HPO60678.1 sigma 54-interacting transcriptional regulator [Exilispira sp.]
MIEIEKIAKILEIFSLLTSSIQIEDLLKLIIDNATNVIAAEASSLLLFDDNKENLYFYIVTGEKRDEIHRYQYELKPGQGIAGWVAKYGSPLIVNNVDEDPRFYPDISKEIHFKTTNILCTPLLIDNEVIGVIELLNKIDGLFNEEDLLLLTAFSKQCSILIQQKKMFHQLKNKTEYLESELNTYKSHRKIIGESTILKEKIKMAEIVAGSDSTVLLQGDSGTGKELFAELIHNLSKRSSKPFVKVNCAAIPETLLESELFGYTKGAFTGAFKDTPGKFELANGGTIFLDEIGEIPITTQAKLLRFLESREIQKLGATTPVEVNVRIIAATNKDLPVEVAKKKFREDLYYRLTVFPIYIPPLKERAEDIPILANHFLEKYNKELNKKISSISDEAMNILKDYHWPGNIRELENIIERACVICDTDTIEPQHIILNAKADIFSVPLDNVVPLKDAINIFKKKYITNILSKNGWKQNEAARQLDIQRTYLSRLIKELDINKN